MIVLALALLFGLEARTSGEAGYPGLYVTFLGDDSFSMTLDNGTPVGTTSGPPTLISAGTYEVFVNDASGAVMQLDLSGQGVDLVTNMTNGEDLSQAFVETFLPNSTYTFQNDYQPGVVWTFGTTATTLTGSASSNSSSTAVSTLPVSSSTASTSSGSGPKSSALGTSISTSAATSALEGSLAGTVNAAGRLDLSFKGKSVTTLKAGRYTVTVTDTSKKAGFTLQETDRAPITVTGAAFTGKHTTTIDLTVGQWLYYPTFVGKKTYFLVVASTST